MVKKLLSIGFQRSEVDECVFYKSNAYILYTDDSIFTEPDEKELAVTIAEIKAVGLDLTGNVSDFLGVKIERKPDGSVVLTQPHLIDQILEALASSKVLRAISVCNLEAQISGQPPYLISYAVRLLAMLGSLPYSLMKSPANPASAYTSNDFSIGLRIMPLSFVFSRYLPTHLSALPCSTVGLAWTLAH